MSRVKGSFDCRADPKYSRSAIGRCIQRTHDIKYAVVAAPLMKFLISLTLSLPTSLWAQQRVRIQVNADNRQGAFKTNWAYFGHDEPNFTYMKYGRQLLSELSAISPDAVHIRTHNLLTTGDGAPALKWGSTNAYTEDASGRPIYNWTVLDKIFDTYHGAGIAPFVEIAIYLPFCFFIDKPS